MPVSLSCILASRFRTTLVALLPCALSSAKALGTVLYSPHERDAVVRQRTIEDPAQPSQTLQVSGLVKRSQGPSTVWLNRQAVPQGRSFAPVRRIRVDANGVTLDGHRMRVGERLDLLTHARSDLVAGDALTVRGVP